jgi:hypothetical protein
VEINHDLGLHQVHLGVLDDLEVVVDLKEDTILVEVHLDHPEVLHCHFSSLIDVIDELDYTLDR